jgi:hypothetical protein
MSRVLALAAVALKSAEGGAAGVLRGTASSSQEPTPVPLPVTESWGEEQPASASLQSSRRVDLFNSIKGEATGSDTARTQRWVGAAPTADNMFVSDIQCTYKVPLDSDVELTPGQPDAPCGQVHYIYCQMDSLSGWPETDQGRPGFSQFVPQLMRGMAVSGYEPSDYAPRWKFLDTWAIQAQYYFEPVKGEGTKAYTGEYYFVSPGDTVHTRMYFGQSSSGKYGYTLQVWTDETPKSSITVTVPFMGLAPGVTAEYGHEATDLAPQYYQFRASALHEAWCMDDPGYFPQSQAWKIFYEASQGQRIDEQPWNSCCDHSQDPCVPCDQCCMRPEVLLNEAGVAALEVYRSGAGEQ